MRRYCGFGRICCHIVASSRVRPLLCSSSCRFCPFVMVTGRSSSNLAWAARPSASSSAGPAWRSPRSSLQRAVKDSAAVPQTPGMEGYILLLPAFHVSRCSTFSPLAQFTAMVCRMGKSPINSSMSSSVLASKSGRKRLCEARRAPSPRYHLAAPSSPSPRSRRPAAPRRPPRT